MRLPDRTIITLLATVAAVSGLLVSLPADAVGVHVVDRHAAAPIRKAGTFVPLDPARVLDTRIGRGAPAGPVHAGQSVVLAVDGHGGVPASGVSAVVLTVTVTGATGAGYVTAFPNGVAKPTASNVNYVKGRTVANLVVARIGTAGAVDLCLTGAGTAQLVADVSGYYVAGASAVPGSFAALTPARLLDTRNGTGGTTGAVTAGRTVTVPVAGHGGVPVAKSSSVILNVTVTAATGPGYVTAYPTGGPLPKASNLNYVPGRTVPNVVLARIGTNGSVDLHVAGSGTVQLVVDVSGYFLAGGATDAGSLVALAPSRVLDTRDGTGAAQAPVSAGTTVQLSVAGAGGVPSTGAITVVLTVTVTGATGPGVVTVYRDGATRPTASNLNYSKGDTVANLVVVRIGTSGSVDLHVTGSGTVHLIADVSAIVGDGTLGAVTGTVTDADGRRLGGVDIAAALDSSAAGAATSAPQAITAADGTYTISGLPADEYDVCFDPAGAFPRSDTGYVAQCYHNTSADPDQVEVQASQVRSAVDATIGLGAAYTGSVEDVSGKPLGGIITYVYYFSGETAPAPVRTSKDGLFRVNGVAPGASLQICTEAGLSTTPGSAPAGYLSGCAGSYPSPGPGQAASVGTISMYAAVGVSGTVTDSAGHPLAHVGIGYGAGSSGYNEPVTQTNSKGQYTILGIDNDAAFPEKVYVCFLATSYRSVPVTGGASTTGYVDECYDQVAPNPTTSAGDSTPISIPQGQIATGINGRLAAAAAVSGTVTDPSGHGIAGVEVVAQTDDRTSTTTYVTATTAANGSYRIPNLDPDTYFVCFFPTPGNPLPPPTGYLSQCYEGVGPDSSKATLLSLSSGRNTVGIDATLNGGGQVSGRVTDADNHPVQGVIVNVAGSGYRNSATTAVDGTYSVRYVAAGTVSVCFDPSQATGGDSTTGYLAQCWKTKPDMTSATPVTVAVGRTTADVDAALMPAGGVDVTITDRQGTPLSGAYVALYQGDQNNSGSAKGPTGNTGNETFTNLTPGDYVICVNDTSGITGGVSTTGYQPTCFGRTATAPFTPVAVGSGSRKVTLELADA